jgi:DNA-binding transcriptional ArsR family regulator
MSRAVPESAASRRAHAVLFAALGDDTRLRLLAALAAGTPRSIATLTLATPLTRQAVTKHLRVLEAAGMVRRARSGRESLFEFDPRPVSELQEYLSRLSAQWDQALTRLKLLVEG